MKVNIDVDDAAVAAAPPGVQLALSVISSWATTRQPPALASAPQPVVKAVSVGPGITSDEWGKIVSAVAKARKDGQSEEQAIAAFLETPEGAKAFECCKAQQARSGVAKQEAEKTATDHGIGLLVAELREHRHDLNEAQAWAHVLNHDERAQFLYNSTAAPSAMP